MCIQKHVSSELAWDEVVHIACAAYISVPMIILNRVYFTSIWESNIYTVVVQILNFKLRSVGNDKNILLLDAF